MFKSIMGKNMDAFIDNIVIKIKKEPDHIRDLAKVFTILKKHKLSLNVVKCAFKVSSGKFLGDLVT